MQDVDQWDTLFQHFAREALMWIHLKHLNVIQLYGIDTEWFRGTPCMVMPWVEETNIRSYMEKNQELITGDQLNVWVSCYSIFMRRST